MTPREKDIHLVKQALKGDEAAWNEIYSKNRAKIHAIVGRIAGYEQAEDLTQDTFLQLHRKLHQFKGESALSTWLYRIASNVALMWLRRPRPDMLSIDGNDFDEVPQELQIGVEDQRLTSAHMRIKLEQAIDALPPVMRTHLILHDLEGWQHKETAELLGVDIGTTKSTLHFARKNLRDRLKDEKHPTIKK